MIILYNNELTKLPDNNMTLADSAAWKKIPANGTAIAVNDKLVKHDNWESLKLKEMDQVVVISGAYGG